MNVSFGIEFDDDVMCAVDKLERDYVLKEATNSCNTVTETSQDQRPNNDEQSHRKEKYSRRKVGENLPGSSRRKMHNSGTDGGCMKLGAADDPMSTTVIKGHCSGKVLSSTHDEATDQDVVCTWNSPLLVSTPAVGGSRRRRVANENAAKSSDADGAATDVGGLTVTPKQQNSARKPKTKNAEKTKLFQALLSVSLNASSPTEPASLQNEPQSPGSARRCISISNGKGNSSSAISDHDSKF